MYGLFIDEVGNSSLKISTPEINDRYFSLTGVILHADYAQGVLTPQLNDFKSKGFVAPIEGQPVILHRSKIKGADQEFEKLKDKNVRARFDRELLSLLQSWEYVVVSVCIDKKQHKESYAHCNDVYHYCLEVLLERYFFFLKSKNASGEVVAEARGGKEDYKLKNKYKNFYFLGTRYVKSLDLQKYLKGEELIIKSKPDNVAGLQLCDLVAYPSFQEILCDNGVVRKQELCYSAKIVNILCSKYYSEKGKNYGKKFINNGGSSEPPDAFAAPISG